MYGFKQSFIFERLSEKCKCITLKSYLRNAESSSADTKTIGIRQRSALSCCGSSKPLILGKRTDLGEFGIDLQNAVICVEQNDGFCHSPKHPVGEALCRVSVSGGICTLASSPTVEILARPSERIGIIQTPTSDSNRQFCPFQHFRLIEFLLTAVGFTALTCATTFWHGACLTESCDASDHF